jgi:hypothetical protein
MQYVTLSLETFGIYGTVLEYSNNACRFGGLCVLFQKQISSAYLKFEFHLFVSSFLRILLVKGDPSDPPRSREADRALSLQVSPFYLD